MNASSVPIMLNLVALVVAFFSGELADANLQGALVTLFLLVIGNIVWIGILSKQRGGGPACFGFFLFFVLLFYGFRGMTFMMAGDSELMTQIGVSHPDIWLSKALWMVTVFVSAGSLVYGLALGWSEEIVPVWITRFIAKYRPLSLLRDDARTSPGLLIGLALAWSAAAVVTVLVVRKGSVEGLFNIILPTVFGLVMFAYIMIAYRRDGSVDWRMLLGCAAAAIGISMFARDAFSTRMWAFGILALLLISVLHYFRVYLVGMMAVVLALPVIQLFGENRYVKSDDFFENLSTQIAEKRERGMADFVLGPYAIESGDFTALDLFSAVLHNGQEFRPWGLSFLYPFVHWVPRQMWESKPEEGILTDEESFRLANTPYGLRMIPYDPGIVGTLYLEGGKAFVVLLGAVAGLLAVFFDTLLARLASEPSFARFGRLLFTIGFFCCFYAARARPYQVMYLAGFMIVGILLAGKIHQACLANAERS